MSQIDLNLSNERLPVNRFTATGWPEIPRRLIHYLNENDVRYEIVHRPHPSCARKLSLRTARYHARVIIVRAGPQHLVAVLPANSQIDLKGFARFGRPVRLETEEEFKWFFPDCVPGAIPPFGNLYGLPTLVDNAFRESEYIAFTAGTDSDSIKLSYPAYAKLVQPHLGSFSIKLASRPRRWIDRPSSI
jgi:Ala-tRNA(Pro) deacylase